MDLLKVVADCERHGYGVVKFEQGTGEWQELFDLMDNLEAFSRELEGARGVFYV